MPEDDHLDRNVSLSASLEDRGLRVGASSRAVAAFDRLCGGVIDLPCAYLEGVTERARARNKIKLRSIEADTEFSALPEASQEILEGIVSTEITASQIRKLENKNRVALRAVEELNSSEAPISSEDPIDKDWLSYFEGYAEKASTERMQGLWAKVLAGEIRKQGEFSLSTMRFLSELDNDIAEIFQRECVLILDSRSLIKQGNLKGGKLLDVSFLEEIGLLSEVSGNIEHTAEPDQNRYAHWISGNLQLIVKAASNLHTPVMLITRTGREILKLLPPPDDRKILNALYELHQAQVSSAELHLIVGKNSDGSARTQLLEKLKEESAP
ncbi:DUF2806 domain-containing protein [Halocynthiibacter sp.]|uniref:DUF2806 domain-containing protein n=1 Tax=Halocynthiibacter sp. TaxID=1979210 RepID=UPI003C4243F8